MADEAEKIRKLQEHAHHLAKEIDGLKMRLRQHETEIGSLRGDLMDAQRRIKELEGSGLNVGRASR